MAHGAKAVLRKPVSAASIAHVIRACVRGAAQSSD
jgi:hypothetical protein